MSNSKKLSREQFAAARELRNRGETEASIAKFFGISEMELISATLAQNLCHELKVYPREEKDEYVYKCFTEEDNDK